MKWAEAGIILSTGLAQTDVSADDLNDVGLLLDGLGKIGHGAWSILEELLQG